MIPLAYGVVRDELPARHLSRAVSVLTAAGAAFGAGLGPVVMGAVLNAYGWEAVFWVTGAVVVVALAVGAATLRGGGGVSRPLRPPGRGGARVTLLVLLIGITNGSRGAGPRPRAHRGPARRRCRAWWVRWERARADPIVDLALSDGVRPARPPRRHHGGLRHLRPVHRLVHAGLDAGGTGHGLGRTVAVAGLVQLPGAVMASPSSSRTSDQRRPGFVAPPPRRAPFP